MAKTFNRTVAVFGAYGHTGKFVVDALLTRGWTPILSGRNRTKLATLGTSYPHLEVRPASSEDPRALDAALAGAVAVINCAGPFLDTASPMIEAALRNRIHYLDITAEQRSVLNTYEQFAQEAEEKEIVVLPAMAFYGGLADLLASAALGDWSDADAIDIAIALDSWKPTLGTRLTGQRNSDRRLIFSNHSLQFISDPLPTRRWKFSGSFGEQEVVSFPLTEVITISKHINVSAINPYINLTPLQDIHDQDTPPPQPADDSGRSSQLFVMEVVVRSGEKVRRATAAGRDIYAITAPLIVEAALRITHGLSKKRGVVSPGEAFEAGDFLKSLDPEHLSVDIQDQ